MRGLGGGVVRLAGLGAMVLAAPNVAQAHRGPLDRAAGWSDWNTDPVVWLSLFALGWLYLRGRGVLQSRAPGHRLADGRRLLWFFAGWMVLGLALLSPVDPASDQLAWVHMVQHMLLMNVAAPLLVLAAPHYVMLWAWPLGARRLYARCRRWVLAAIPPGLACSSAVVCWWLYAVVLWSWHLPGAYEAALRHTPIHDLEHLSFFLVAYLFWQVLLDPASSRRLTGLAAVIYLFTTTIHATVLGVFLTIAPTPWYPTYHGWSGLWGLSLLEDQQLAGLIMWMPACLPFVVAALIILARGLQLDDTQPPAYAEGLP